MENICNGSSGSLNGRTLRERKVANIAKAAAALDEFDRVFGFIEPLMKAHPEWLWRDAVAYLETHGGLPE